MELWSLQGPLRHRVLKFITLAPGILGVPLLYGWLTDATAFTQPYMVGAFLGLLLVTVLAGGLFYRRERRLYDRWRAGERASSRYRR